MTSVPCDFARTLRLCQEIIDKPTSLDELEFAGIIKPLKPPQLTDLDEAIDKYALFQLARLSLLASRKFERSQKYKRLCRKHAMKLGGLGLGGTGISYAMGGTLSKIHFVAGVVLLCYGATNLLFSYLLSSGASLEDYLKAKDINTVQGKMRLAIASRLERSGNDQLVRQGKRQFDLHARKFVVQEQKIRDHDNKHVSHENKFAAQQRENQSLRDQNRALACQQAETNRELAEQRSAQAETDREVAEQRRVQAEQAEIIRDLMQRLEAQANPVPSQAQPGA